MGFLSAEQHDQKSCQIYMSICWKPMMMMVPITVKFEHGVNSTVVKGVSFQMRISIGTHWQKPWHKRKCPVTYMVTTIEYFISAFSL